MNSITNDLDDDFAYCTMCNSLKPHNSMASVFKTAFYRVKRQDYNLGVCESCGRVRTLQTAGTELAAGVEPRLNDCQSR